MSKRIYGSTVYDSACENYFYDLDNKDEKHKKIFEEEFSLIEISFSNLLNRFINICKNKENYESSLITTKKEREEFSYYLTIQLLRTKKFRELNKEVNQKSFDNYMYFYKMYKEKYLNEELRYKEMVIQVNSKKKHLNILVDDDIIAMITGFISNSYWTFIYNDTSNPFIISDNPVCRIPYINENNSKRRIEPFRSDFFQLFIPLSPNISLCVYREDSIFCKKFTNKLHNRLTIINNIDLINNINKYQCIMGHEKIFFNSENEYLIKEYCSDDLTQNGNLFF